LCNPEENADAAGSRGFLHRRPLHAGRVACRRQALRAALRRHRQQQLEILQRRYLLTRFPRIEAGPGARSGDDPAIPARIGARHLGARTCVVTNKNRAKARTHNTAHSGVFTIVVLNFSRDGVDTAVYILQQHVSRSAFGGRTARLDPGGSGSGASTSRAPSLERTKTGLRSPVGAPVVPVGHGNGNFRR